MVDTIKWQVTTHMVDKIYTTGPVDPDLFAAGAEVGYCGMCAQLLLRGAGPCMAAARGQGRPAPADATGGRQ